MDLGYRVDPVRHTDSCFRSYLSDFGTSSGYHLTMTETHEYRTYQPGDMIRIALKLSDESGVGRIIAAFSSKSDSTRQVLLYGDGEGKTSGEVILETAVSEGTAPGKYYCYSLDMYDARGNRTLLSNPGIEFEIENVPGDHEGPKFEGWRVVDLTEEEMRLLRALYDRRSNRMNLVGETLALSVGIEDYEEVLRTLVDSGYAASHVDDDGDEYLEITHKGVTKLQVL